MLTLLLPTVGKFEAFCIDYFPEVASQFPTGMDRLSRENLLLASVEPTELVRALRAHDGDGFARHAALLACWGLAEREVCVVSRPHLFIEIAPDRSQRDAELYHVTAYLAWEERPDMYTGDCILPPDELILDPRTTGGGARRQLQNPVRREDLEGVFMHVSRMVATGALPAKADLTNLMIEIFVPRRLIGEAFECYRKAAADTLLGCEHPVVLRSMERLEELRLQERIREVRKSGSAWRSWDEVAEDIQVEDLAGEFARRQRRWDQFRNLRDDRARLPLQRVPLGGEALDWCAVLPNQVYPGNSEKTQMWSRLNPSLNPGQPVSVLLQDCPCDIRQQDVFDSLIRSGVPIICWLRPGLEQERACIHQLLSDRELASLPALMREQRYQAYRSDTSAQAAGNLVLFWDNPYRYLPRPSLRMPRRGPQ